MNVDWTAVFASEATVIGVLIAVILAILFGLLVPHRYVKGLEKRIDYQQETLDKQAESIKTIADWTGTQTAVGENVAHTLSTLQQGAGERQ